MNQRACYKFLFKKYNIIFRKSQGVYYCTWRRGSRRFPDGQINKMTLYLCIDNWYFSYYGFGEPGHYHDMKDLLKLLKVEKII